jgi:hypothetical protein
VILVIILIYIFQDDISLHLVVFHRCLFRQSVMLIMRSVSISVTSLSVLLADCSTTAIGLLPIEAVFIMFSIHGIYGDVLFSEHVRIYT